MFVLWGLLSGTLSPLLLALGTGSAFFVLMLTVRFGITEKHTHLPGLYFRLPVFACWLAGRIFVSSLRVALSVLRPHLNINPMFITVKMEHRSDLALTIHANSITMTPGTVSTDIIDNGSEVHVLCHDSDTQSDFQNIEKKMLFLKGGAP